MTTQNPTPALAFVSLTGQDKEYNEIKFTRLLIANIITQAVVDLKNDKEYERQNTQNHKDKDRESALHFIRSREYEAMCDALGWPACQIRRVALK